MVLHMSRRHTRVRFLWETTPAGWLQTWSSPVRLLVTLVSHSQPLWRGVTQGGVAPVFPFRANP